ncbi:MAG: Lrp/AsnC family transcriptional regulator [Micrococcales bacterium]|nr:Lrp/AsnC family transcriptional regulator [Micrococcales bacterium]MBT5398052.1 Lrp/AsnC family transcriptional regulator [Micrococcales bacterium]MBT5430961.1 Lrp/AsnC family transcriptional regulator [Micrococcales bacterium]MBT5848601.1 Lrp/AsnC family transcriptional regulator [Micrococcales bacterium]MDG1817772.1 Lrp/AsnC family transcriptional regulator [Aquiluna sp.]
MAKSQDIQSKFDLDDIDRAILAILGKNGRISNADLAAEVGLAPSTCLGRVRNLVESGVIRSFAAEIEPEALGLNLQALISVTLRAGARANLATFMKQMQEHPQVIQVFFLGGSEDFIVHVAVPDSDAVREFVLDQLSNNASVANTRTNIVFDHFHKGPIG